MKILKKLRSENLIPIILFLVILINYIPLFIGNFSRNVSYAVNTKEMAICFGIELVLLSTFLIGRVKVFPKNTLINLALLIITTIILFVIQINNYNSGNYEKLDFINITCIFLNILMLFIAFLNLKIEEKYIIYFFIGMVILGIVSCIVNIYLYNEEITTMIKSASQISVKSFFAHRNQFAIFLFASIISNIMLILKSKNKMLKILLFVPLLVLGANLITTSSRTGIAATIIFLGLFFITTNTIKLVHKFFIVYLSLVVLLCSYMILSNKSPEFVIKTESFVENVLIREQSIKSFTGRELFWNIAKDTLSESKVKMCFGMGRFLSINLIEVYYVTQYHNFYIEALMTGGIMELSFFIFIHIYILVKVFKSKIDLKYKLMYLSMMISLAIYGIFESMSRFSIGCADTLCLVFFITIPLLHSNTFQKEEVRKQEIEMLESGETENKQKPKTYTRRISK